MQRIAIVDPSESSREALRTLLLGVDFVWLEAECARYEYFPDVIAQSNPDLVIIQMDSDRNKSLMLVNQIAQQYPKLSILTACSDSNSLLQSLQKGAKHFLTPPISLEDLVSILRKALNESSTSISGQVSVQGSSGNIISILGSRGGVGCTAVAVNLAATFQSQGNNQVALLDLDLALGDADVALELPANEMFSLADLARNIERLDMNFLRRAMIKHPASGVSVLRHPLELNEIGIVHEGHVERILNLLRISYSHLILDLSKSLLPTDQMGLRLSDMILVIAQLELSSLRNVVRLLHSLGNEGGMNDKIQVVLNRVGSEYQEEGITIKKAEEVIGRPIYWQIPNDPKPLMAARIDGTPLIKHAPKAKLQQNFTHLTQLLSGKPIENETKKRGWFS